MNDIGVFIEYRQGIDLGERISDCLKVGATCCHLAFWDTTLYTKKSAEDILSAFRGTGFKIAALWAGWSGTCIWNLTEGPDTIGLVPDYYREARTRELMQASEFAKMIGVDTIITHVGFLPNDPADKKYICTIEALRTLIGKMKENGQTFLFEVGQETPKTLIRAITDIGYDNVGINLDTANLILYGMSSTLDALDVFKSLVKSTHIKDGLFPTEKGKLGKEVKAGEGEANIPEVISRLLGNGYTGPLVIEREIKGDEQRRDIIATVEYIKNILED